VSAFCSVSQQIKDCVVWLAEIDYYFLWFLVASVTYYQSNWSHVGKTLFLKKTAGMLGLQFLQPEFYSCSVCLPLRCMLVTHFLLKMSKCGSAFMSSAHHSGSSVPVTFQCYPLFCFLGHQRLEELHPHHNPCLHKTWTHLYNIGGMFSSLI
jgi:hypothetical protein